jgi:hypothetical protein
MVLLEGIELSTSPLPRVCSTTELQQRAKAHGGFLGWLPARCNPAVIDTTRAPPQIRTVTQPPKPESRLTPAAAKARAEREARQAEALRANLRRRKAQARGRDPDKDPAPEAGGRDSHQDPAPEAGDNEAADGPHSVYPNISD